MEFRLVVLSFILKLKSRKYGRRVQRREMSVFSKRPVIGGRNFGYGYFEKSVSETTLVHRNIIC